MTTTRPDDPPARGSLGVADGLLAAIARRSEDLRARSTDEHRKRWGQYFTVPTIARFMARLIDVPGERVVRVLDPGAGTGMLGVAVAVELLSRGSLQRVELMAVEPEPEARELLRATLRDVAMTLGPRFRHQVTGYNVLDLARHVDRRFHVAVSNPPYFKMSPTDARGGDSPNIYTRFMEVCASLLEPGGQLCFIIPRSFVSGHYFRRFRRRFHREYGGPMTLERVHVFGSRRDAFRDDGVLQETMIVRYRRDRRAVDRGRGDDVVITESAGVDELRPPTPAPLSRTRTPSRGRAGSAAGHTPRKRSPTIRVSRAELFDPRGSIDARLCLPLDAEDLRVLRIVRSWSYRLADYGLEISTGPVVPFRAKHWLRKRKGIRTLPLLWMHHVQPGQIVWPLKKAFQKPEYIRDDAPPALLLPNKTCILMRRFSAKEERRRLTVATLRGGELPRDRIGVENHVNVIHRPGAAMPDELARGLTNLLGSPTLDRYMRITSGHTQINATDMRALPLPPPDVLYKFEAE